MLQDCRVSVVVCPVCVIEDELILDSCVVAHTKGKTKDISRQEATKIKHSRKGRTRHAYKRYVHAQMQDLYKKNPGGLARYARENTKWYDPMGMELHREEIISLNQEPWSKNQI